MVGSGYGVFCLEFWPGFMLDTQEVCVYITLPACVYMA